MSADTADHRPGADGPHSNGRDRSGFDPLGPLPEGSPDALEHLWAAAHEMLQAMRTLIDAADEFVEEQRKPRPPSEPKLHRIDIDGD